jgi:hypothetical protein
MVGHTLDELGVTREIDVKHVAVKESVFPFNKFPGVDSVLGPEMKSTGEVMGIDDDFGIAFSKAQMGTGQDLPMGKRFGGTVFISVKNKDKRVIVFIAKELHELGFRIVATEGTAKALRKHGIPVAEVIGKVWEKGRGTVVDRITRLEVDLIINTPMGKGPLSDNYLIRQQAIIHKIPCFTTISAAAAGVNAIESLMRERGLLAEEESLRGRLEKSSASAIFVSVEDKHRNEKLVSLVRILNHMKPLILATKGTADFLSEYGIRVKEIIPRISQGMKKSIIEFIDKDKVALILNVVERKNENAVSDAFIIRRAAISQSIPYLTAVEEALGELQPEKQLPLFRKKIKKLQDYYSHFDLPKPAHVNPLKNVLSPCCR